MQYEVSSVDEYLKAVEPDPKYSKFVELREHILTNYPELNESLEYKLLRYGDDKIAVFYIQVQKQHIGLYVGDINKVQKDRPLLNGVNHGKGCIRLRKTTDLSETGIVPFIKKTVELWKAGEDIGC